MSITIYYRGRLNAADKIDEFLTDVSRMCDDLGWAYEKVIESNPPVKGLIIDPSELCEPVAFLFSKTGLLLNPIELIIEKKVAKKPSWVFVKTQFAGPEIHARVVSLLKHMKEKYMSNLEVKDEGGYWETENFEVLKGKIEAIDKMLDRVVKRASVLCRFVESIETNPRHCSTTDEDLKKVYGEDAVISRVGNFNLIHLDHPDDKTIARRIRQFDPNEEFPDDCPLCQQMREQGCNVVFDRADQ